MEIGTMEVFFVMLCTTWLSLTLYKQFDKSIRGLVRYDVFALIPVWTLFAPKPSYTDYKVFYRDSLQDGKETALREIIFENSQFRKVLWAGQNREKKLISIICKDASDLKKKKQQVRFFIDRKTQMFRNYCKYYKHVPEVVDRQVIVLKTFGYTVNRKEEIIFITNISYA